MGWSDETLSEGVCEAFYPVADGRGPELEWFKRRFSMFQDILRESSVYQEIVEKRIQGQREMVLGFVQMRFPELLALAKQQTEGITDPDFLPSVSNKLLAARTLEEARKVLLSIDRSGTKH